MSLRARICRALTNDRKNSIWKLQIAYIYIFKDFLRNGLPFYAYIYLSVSMLIALFVRVKYVRRRRRPEKLSAWVDFHLALYSKKFDIVFSIRVLRCYYTAIGNLTQFKVPPQWCADPQVKTMCGILYAWRASKFIDFISCMCLTPMCRYVCYVWCVVCLMASRGIIMYVMWPYIVED